MQSRLDIVWLRYLGKKLKKREITYWKIAYSKRTSTKLQAGIILWLAVWTVILLCINITDEHTHSEGNIKLLEKFSSLCARQSKSK